MTVRGGGRQERESDEQRGTSQDTVVSSFASGLRYEGTSRSLTIENSYKGGTVSVANLPSAAANVKVIDASGYSKGIVISGNRSAISIVGGSGGDSLTGSSGADTIRGGAGADTISGGAGADRLFGDTGNDSLNGGAGNDTLSGGSGNDTLTGGSGNDVFVYEGGNDVVSDYSNGTNRISLSGASVSGHSMGSANMFVKTTTGAITINNVKNRTVTIGSAIYYNNLVYDSTKTSATIGSSFRGELKASDYDGNIKTINGSALSSGVTINGNKANNSIVGGSGNDTLSGGSGHDTLTGGAGRDVFVYTAGNDVISDYTSVDTIKFANKNMSVSGHTLKGSDSVFKIGTNTLTVKNTKDAEVTINGTIYYNNIKYDSRKSAVTIGSAFTGTLTGDTTTKASNVTTYATTVKVIDATNFATKVAITGNVQANTISGGKGNDTLRGGAGNDTINGAKGNDKLYGDAGNDTISGSDGNDTLSGGAGADVLFGGVGNDSLAGDEGNDLLYGENGADVLNGGTGNDSLSGGEGNDKLYGEAGNDSLSGGAGNDTLSGGSGNDTLSGGAGNDVFIYEGGDDTVVDYTSGTNTIRLNGATVSDHSLRGNDLYLNTSTGSLTVKNVYARGSSKPVEVTVGSNIYQGNYVYDSKKSAVTLGGGVRGTVSSGNGNSDYNSRTKTVNASRLTSGVVIEGNSQANSILGGSGNDTLRGGTGNDTLTGGAGRDLFVYSSGKDVLTDFVAGVDVLSVVGGVSGAALKNKNDLVLNVGTGTLTIKNGRDQEVTVGSTIYYNNVSYDLSKTTLTVGSGLSVTLNSSDYAGTVANIDGSAIAKKLRLNGNDNDNSIKGGSGSNTLRGGGGNDTLIGGKSTDYYIYSTGDDVIVDYGAKDVLTLESGSVTSYAFEGDDVVFTIGSGTSVVGTVTVKEGNGKSITIKNSARKTTTAVYADGTYGSNSAAPWFAEEDNYSTDTTFDTFNTFNTPPLPTEDEAHNFPAQLTGVVAPVDSTQQVGFDKPTA